MREGTWLLDGDQRGPVMAQAIAEIARDIAALVDAGLITLEHDDDGELRARPLTSDAPAYSEGWSSG